MMRRGKAIVTWLENHWVMPAYGGGVLLGLTAAFFGAGVNTMSGWLYAISGVMLAIAAISLWTPPRSFKGLQIHRSPIRPISVGEMLTVAIQLENTTPRPKTLLQARDQVPSAFGKIPETAIATIPGRQTYDWRYTCQPQRRGIYHWQHLALRTAAPFGLFWCQRPQAVPAHATVYPQILPLTHCPLIDQMSVAAGAQWLTARQAEQANEGLTRALRPYRWGDPTRLIHWRTSARYGELRVREQEELTADNQVLIGVDATSDRWSEAAFESAVTAAASLYIYSLRRQLAVALWLPHTGILQPKHTVLSALAAVMPQSQPSSHQLPARAMIWLSPGGDSNRRLPSGSVWVQWLEQPSAPSAAEPFSLSISLDKPLIEQLQSNV
ncbi:MAG: DUF58 domain-containing protein [Cyanobacteria bacterium J06638_28]